MRERQYMKEFSQFFAQLTTDNKVNFFFLKYFIHGRLKYFIVYFFKRKISSVDINFKKF